jgi:hypothetical protein
MSGDTHERPPPDRRAELIRALLAEAATPRRRVVDDHMFVVERAFFSPASFRLQLFTAPQARPVAVAIQRTDEGASLISACERYAEAVWQHHCSDEPQPPIWIQRLLLPERQHNDFTFVPFPVEGRHRLGAPERWIRITEHEITELVGAPVDPARGSGFRPRHSEPEPEPRYGVAWVLQLPRPAPFRNPQCMPRVTSWLRWTARQLFPLRHPSTCCWMHQGSWRQVSKTAITLVRQAQRAGLGPYDIYGHVLDQARAAGTEGWEFDALEALVNSGDGIQLDKYDNGRRFYINGQHKTRAMLDQGVRRTVVIRWHFPGT